MLFKDHFNSKYESNILLNFDLLDPVDFCRGEILSEIIQEYMSKLVNFFEKNNAYIKIINFKNGPDLFCFEFKLISDFYFNQVEIILLKLAEILLISNVEVIAKESIVEVRIKNRSRREIRLVSLLKSESFYGVKNNDLILIALGVNAYGDPYIFDLRKPHYLLIHGFSGTGKTFILHSIIMSLLFRYSSKKLKLILMGDCKLEFDYYESIPHLISPIISDVDEVISALEWCVREVEYRYKIISFLRFENIESYNCEIEASLKKGNFIKNPILENSLEYLKPFPLIVVIINEFPYITKDQESRINEIMVQLISRARVVGIYLVIKTVLSIENFFTNHLIDNDNYMNLRCLPDSKVDIYFSKNYDSKKTFYIPFIHTNEIRRVCAASRRQGYPEYIDEILNKNEGEKDYLKIDLSSK